MTGRFDWVLFDLDGTVWDSAPGIIDGLVHTLRTMGLPERSRDELAANLGPPLIEMLAEVGVPPDRLDEGRDVYRARYRSHGEFDVTVYEGMADLLDELRAAGIGLATATSKGIDPTVRMLTHLGLADRFDRVAAASMDASAHHKVDVIAEALRQAAPDHGAAVAMVGDRHYDMIGGRSFGLTTVGVTWGYGTRNELAGCEPDHLVDALDQLADVLLGRGR